MKSLTVAYLTARQEPQIQWFLDGLRSQSRGDPIKVIVVDHNANSYNYHHDWSSGLVITFTEPKPNVWQGPHRLTPDQWWAKAAYINTAACLCQTEWIAFVDDRSVLMPTWLGAIQKAMKGEYAVAGAYEKRSGMTVVNGEVCDPGVTIGTDPRLQRKRTIRSVAGGSWYGCTNALPLEWLLQINGADESCDSLGMEDVVMGRMLEANGFPIKYDPAMMIIEDRSPEFYEALVRRTDKGLTPLDKSHGILAKTAGKLQATHHWNLREIRESVQRGEPFPIPTEPKNDWWDGQPLTHFP